jgi:hypothetical protein
VFCVKCGTKNEGAAFCVSCGSPLEVSAVKSGKTGPQGANTSTSVQGKLSDLMKNPAARFAAIGAGAVVVLGIVMSSGVLSPNPLQQAYEDCSLESVEGTQLADGGSTLVVDTMGEEEFSGASYADFQCVLTSLETPTRITTRMGETSASDGQVTDSAEGLNYFWSYHPDDGILLTVSRD